MRFPSQQLKEVKMGFVKYSEAKLNLVGEDAPEWVKESAQKEKASVEDTEEKEEQEEKNDQKDK